MSDLFGHGEMIRSAVITGDGDEYRVELRRVWADGLPLLVVCMLNPSTANAEIDDPTVLALIHFARLWGYGGLLIVNLFSLRSPSPAVMMASDRPIGPGTAEHLQAAIEYARDHPLPDTPPRILAAWGNDGDHEDRAEWFCSRAFHHGVELICLGTTQSWKPKHPMARGRHRIPRDQQPIVYRHGTVAALEAQLRSDGQMGGGA